MSHEFSSALPINAASQGMVALLSRLAPTEGVTLSRLDGVKFIRESHSYPRKPVFYEPSIVVVCQGRKRGFLGHQTFIYNAQQYLVLAAPLPFECEAEASEEEPLLAVSIRVDLMEVADLLIALNDTHGVAQDKNPRVVYATSLNPLLSDALLRLLAALATPYDADILGPSILREIYYRVLTDDQGEALRLALASQQYFGSIAKVLRHIHTHYHECLDIATLAQAAGMSSANFHAQFKVVTSTSPMQYVKTTRLHQARRLIVQEGMNVGAAATYVGYESTSQFSREFKRLFGLSPVDEARRIQSPEA